VSNFIVFFTPLDPTRDAEYLKQHIEYFDKLRAEGHVIANGKLEDGSGGIAIFQASSKQEVEQLLAADPFVALHIRKAEVKAWGAKWRSGNELNP